MYKHKTLGIDLRIIRSRADNIQREEVTAKVLIKIVSNLMERKVEHIKILF